MSLQELIETHLRSLVSSGDDLCSQAVRYALLGKGKRFRPKLTLAITEILGGAIEDALSPACSIEMIHAYSMIHDDLPCMDDDDMRRGMPTVHRAFPEGIAVLAGDWLLTQAFEVIVDSPNLSPEKKVALTAILAKRAGGQGMIGGQVLDLNAEGKALTLDDLQCIHQRKTGALITAAVEFGSIVACGHAQERLTRYGEHLGHAFQIVDDILDVTCGEEKHGCSSDIKNGKATYVTLLGLQGACEATLNHLLLAKEALPTSSSYLDETHHQLATVIGANQSAESKV